MSERAEDRRKPHPTDAHVGMRVRMRRKLMGVSQERLAEALDLTFQQVQKYEKGTNRISASKLFEAAKFLDVEIGYFFEGLSREASEGMSEPPGEPFAQSFFMTHEGVEFASLFPQLSPRQRRHLVELARTFVEECPPARS
ncbi:helix-turn-helix transcriptional regulator [Brevundimonas sp.]|uniref:helix-turn-helix domain-containing protein n=1 Tax=Brevundimonas sp. TaxID=1871086 RepID=UPI0025FCAF79|nr:helix-turn-helix transcriptional regulator [Brevundimonas sp.]